VQSFIAACVVAIIIAIGAVYVLDSYQEPAEVAYKSSTGVRL
jgi:hypothetical protein